MARTGSVITHNVIGHSNSSGGGRNGGGDAFGDCGRFGGLLAVRGEKRTIGLEVDSAPFIVPLFEDLVPLRFCFSEFLFDLRADPLPISISGSDLGRSGLEMSSTVVSTDIL